MNIVSQKKLTKNKMIIMFSFFYQHYKSFQKWILELFFDKFAKVDYKCNVCNDWVLINFNEF